MKKEMKTSVKMIRLMDDMEVIQRTKDGYFDANNLIIQWNRSNKRRRLDDYLNSKTTKEFIEEIERRESLGENSPLDYQAVKIVKKKRKPDGTLDQNEVWLNSYLFLDFAMWINPRFKYDVIKFVYDRLIEFRIDVGGGYKNLSSVGSRLKGYNYPYVATALNHIVFGKTGKDLRQEASQDQLKELDKLQDNLVYLIENRFIKTYIELIQHLRELYCRKNGIDFSEEIKNAKANKKS